jgi:pimeloyl-ACP methyl ester carboxylesterase
MFSFVSRLLFCMAAILLSISIFPSGARAGMLPPPEAAAARVKLAENYGKLPLRFEQNQGQTASEVKFLARGAGYSLFLTQDEAVMSLRKAPESASPGSENATKGAKPVGAEGKPRLAKPPVDRKAGETQGSVLRMRLAGTREMPRILGRERQAGAVNYLKGRDPGQWRTGVAAYGKVEYQSVYPGVDLLYYGRQGQLEYDFIVAPGADPGLIRLSFAANDAEGERALAPRLDAGGDLLLSTAAGEVRLRKLVAYQMIDGQRREVNGRFALWPPSPSSSTQEGRGDGVMQVGFSVDDYDRERPLVIDPVLAYSSYLGGRNADDIDGIAVDDDGDIFVTGCSYSPDFPVLNAIYPRLWGDEDVFIIKLSADGQRAIYATYFGGSNSDCSGDIAIDSAGNAHVIGTTHSIDLPTVNAKYPYLTGFYNAFVLKLSSNGQSVSYSTYIGGRCEEIGNGIAVDQSGNDYITGWTCSDNFPLVNALYNNKRMLGFVVKLIDNGRTVEYSTYLGGEGNDIAVDNMGNSYITGQVRADDIFPTINAIYPNFGGVWDAFSVKLSNNGQKVIYSTYLGGSGQDIGYGIASDYAGNAYVVGDSLLNDSGSLADFPVVNAKYPYFSGYRNAFVTKLSSDGQTMVYSTYLGGSDGDTAHAIATDSMGNAYITGGTQSADFPIVNAINNRLSGSSDGFVTKLSPDGQTIGYSTYLGGTDSDSGYDIAVDGKGSVYVTGVTNSTDFPTSATDPQIISYDPTYNGGGDAFVVKITDTDTSSDSNASSDLSVLQHASPDDAKAGQPFQLDFNVKNDGPDPATGIVIAASLPESLHVLSADPACQITGRQVTCRIDYLAKSTLFVPSLYLQWDADATGNFDSVATVTARENDPNPANNTHRLGLDPGLVAVVLVHGLAGSPSSFSGDGGFTDADGKLCEEEKITLQQAYLERGCLPNFGRLLQDRANILVAQPFYYDDKTPLGRSGENWTIEKLAGELHKHIECVLQGGCVFFGTGKKSKISRVDIVAHSMGGLISRAYIADMAIDAGTDQKISYNGKIRKLVMAGTPNYGANVEIIKQFFPLPKKVLDKSVQVSELAFGSPFLIKLDSNWREKVLGENRIDSRNILAIVGTVDAKSSDCDESYNDGIVNIASAVLPEDFLPDSQIRYVPYGHTKLKLLCDRQIVGPATPDDEQHLSYKWAKAFLAGAQLPISSYLPPNPIKQNGFLGIVLSDEANGQPLPASKATLFLDDNKPKLAKPPAQQLTLWPQALGADSREYSLRLAYPGYEPHISTVALKAGRPVIVRAELEKKGAKSKGIPVQFQGNWATPESCDYFNGGGVPEQGVQIDGKGILGYEYYCKLKKITASTNSTLSGIFACSGEGEKSKASINLSVQDGLLFFYQDDAGLTHCH